jgi:hypothetical protein
MVQVDLPAAFTVGHVFAILAKKYLKVEPDLFKNKLLGPLNLYLSCGFSVAGLFLLIGWPSWEIMYIGSWVEAPFNRPLVAGAYVLFLIIMVVLGNIGFILGHYWLRKGKDRLVVFVAVIGGCLTILPFLLKWGVWWKVGTYQMITSGEGYSFWQPPFFHGWIVVMGYLALTTIISGIWFRKQNPGASENNL